MKKILKIAFAAAVVLLASCATKPLPPIAPSIPIAPKVIVVERQAEVTTIQAEKTVVAAKRVENKYKDDMDVVEVLVSAEKTLAESKKTQFELEFLKASAEHTDLKSKELMEGVQKRDEVIYQKDGEIKKVEIKVIEQKAAIAKRNTYLIVAFGAILVLGTLLLKPWRWL